MITVFKKRRVIESPVRMSRVLKSLALISGVLIRTVIARRSTP